MHIESSRFLKFATDIKNKDVSCILQVYERVILILKYRSGEKRQPNYDK